MHLFLLKDEEVPKLAESRCCSAQVGKLPTSLGWVPVQDVVADKAGDAAHKVGDGLKGAADKARNRK